jgi:hypothetical protein
MNTNQRVCGCSRRLNPGNRQDSVQLHACDWARLQLNRRYLTNVTFDERASFENDTRTFMEKSYPEVPYDGFKIGEHDNGIFLPYYNETRPFYFPAHYVEPLEKHWDWLDLDLYGTPRLGAAVKQAVTTRRPTLSGLTPCHNGLNAVTLVNPGIPDMSPRDLSTIAVRINQLLTYISAHLSIEESISVYLYDSTHTNSTDAGAHAYADFLGAATFPVHEHAVQDHGDGANEIDGLVTEVDAHPLMFKQEMDLEMSCRSIHRIR